MEPAGTLLAEHATGQYHCGTIVTGWLKGQHPDDVGVELEMNVCLDFDDGNKYNCYEMINVTVTNCRGYHVYFFPEIIGYYGRYCGAYP